MTQLRMLDFLVACRTREAFTLGGCLLLALWKQAFCTHNPGQ